MVSRSLSILVALIAANVLANARADEIPDAELAGLETWTVEQLCSALDNPEASDELERRDIFDGRERRAIRRDKVREGISEDALLCMKGSPETIRTVAIVEGDLVDAFIYPAGTTDSLIVYMRREADVSTVFAVTESEELNTNASVDSANLLPRGRVCFGQVMMCVPATGAARQQSRAVSQANGFANSPPSLPSQ